MPRVKAQCGWCKNSKVRTNTLRSFAENPVWLIQNVELDSNLKFCPACHLALRKGNSRPDDAYKQRAMAMLNLYLVRIKRGRPAAATITPVIVNPELVLDSHRMAESHHVCQEWRGRCMELFRH